MPSDIFTAVVADQIDACPVGAGAGPMSRPIRVDVCLWRGRMKDASVTYDRVALPNTHGASNDRLRFALFFRYGKY